MQVKKYKCPCCNFYTLMGWPFEICNVCFWECCGIEEDEQIYDPSKIDGVNSVPLLVGQKNYKQYGVFDKQWGKYVRQPSSRERALPNKLECDYIIDEVELPTHDEVIDKLQSILFNVSTRESVACWAEEYFDYDIPNASDSLKNILRELICIDDMEEDGNYSYDSHYIQDLIEKVKGDSYTVLPLIRN